MIDRTTAAAAAALGGLVLCAPAAAQTGAPQAREPAPKPTVWSAWRGFYVGVGLNGYSFDEDAIEADLPVNFKDPPGSSGWMGRIGYAFTPYFAVEAEGGVGGKKDEYESENGLVRAEIGVADPYAVHGVATFPVGHPQGGYQTYLLGKAGYGGVTAERGFNVSSITAPDVEIAGPSAGLGGGLRTERFDLRLEYSQIFGEDDAGAGVFGVSVAGRF